MHPNNRRLVHQGPVQAAPLPCHSPARRRTERWHLRRAARLRAHAACTHASRHPLLHSIQYRAPAVRPDPSARGFRCAPDAPIAKCLFPSLADLQTGPAAPLAGLCSFCHPVSGLAGPASRGQPAAARCGARALRPTTRGAQPRGTPTGIPLPGYTRDRPQRGVGRARLPSLPARALCARNDYTCCCRRSSCS